eukprot:COSAG01_NODE_782_length_13631_cov_73.763450_21_plen_50_part_00
MTKPCPEVGAAQDVRDDDAAAARSCRCTATYRPYLPRRTIEPADPLSKS